MRGAIPLGSVLGIRLRVHVTFLLLLAWAAWEGLDAGGWRAGAWTAALLASAFFCILLHELGHSVVAMRFGVRVQSITLLPIGGVASMGHIPERPLHEFLIAIAGPLVNVVIASVLIACRGGLPDFEAMGDLPASASQWLDFLTVANIALVVFNLIPAFPMDGGRMFRSLLAAFLPYRTATNAAAALGQVIAILFVTVGWKANPVLPLIGVFVFWGAGSEARSVRVRISLQGLRVRDLMRPAAVVHSSDPLDRCAEILHETGQSDFPVVDGEENLVGLLPRARWTQVRGPAGDLLVADVMARRFATVLEDTEAARFYNDLRYFRQDVFPVVSDGKLTGLIRAEDLLRAAGELPEPQPDKAAPRRRGWYMDFG